MTESYNPETLATAYSRLLLSEVGQETIDQINALNSTPVYEFACASHDFTDPNEIFLDAWAETYPSTDFDHENPAHLMAYHAVHQLARVSGFKAGTRSTAKAESTERQIKTDDGTVTYRENPDTARAQFIFSDKPAWQTKKVLEEHGFQWQCDCVWQRQLNESGKDAAFRVIALLSEGATK